MRQRVRKSDETKRAPTSSVRFVVLPSSPVIKLESDDGRCVDGAFVRLAPKLRRSEREAFDASAAKQLLRDRGAIAVVTSPVMLPDDEARPRRSRSQNVDARDEIRAWFGAAPSAEAAEAREGCLRIVDELRF